MNINKEMLIVNVQDKNLEVRCRPDDLKCYNRLLEIITSTTSEQVRQETASYLAAIHCNSEVGQRGTVANEFVEQVLSKLYDAYQESNQRQLLGYYSIIEELMNETERKGVGDLLAHSSLVVTEHLKIKVRNDATYGHDVPNRIEVPFPGSKSLYELLTTLAVQFKCSANEIRLYIDEKEPVRENKNGLAVEDLNLVGKDLVAKKMQR